MSTASMEFKVVVKEVKLIALLNEPRRMVGQFQIPQHLSPAYTNSSSNLSGVGEHGDIRAGPQTSL